MKVGIFIGAESPTGGGSFSFVRAVLSGLAEVTTRHEVHILHTGSAEMASAAGVPVHRVARTKLRPLRMVANRFRTRERRMAIRERDIQREVDALGMDMFWFLTPATLPTSAPYVMTVWDLAHRVEPAFPEVRTTGWTWDARESHYRRWLPRAACVVVGADAGREDIARCYGVSPRNIRIFPLVAPDRNASTAKPIDGLRKPFLLYPAQFWPHKNHIGLLYALREAKDRLGSDLQLVLPGSDKGNLGHVRQVAADLGLADCVLFPGFVSDTELAHLYTEALALVFPSFFGPDNLPPLEAMRFGCPVIAARAPGVEEQLGDAALLVDPRDASSIATAIARVAGDATLRVTLIERGRARGDRWKPRDYAARMIATLDELDAVRRCWSTTSEYRET